MINFYNEEVNRFSEAGCPSGDKFVDPDAVKISWSTKLTSQLKKCEKIYYSAENLRVCSYRPFTKTNLYRHSTLNDRLGKTSNIYPEPLSKTPVISVSGVGARSGFSALMTDTMPDIQYTDNGQCFPLNLYEQVEDADGLFAGQATELNFHTKDGITDAGLAHFQAAYPDGDITKEDLFFYTYGLLHSENYRTRFADNLSKQLPRIPAVKKAADFWAFSKAGRDLAELHVNYEAVEPYAVNYAGGALLMDTFTDADYRVEKMKFGGKGKNRDKSTVIYNSKITMTDIPLEAYDYIVNGKSALDWVMERQRVKTDKASGIVNDANAYATETMKDAAYPLKLFQRVITVSLETIKIVRGLPDLDI